jgi:hypothetical protein
MEHQNINEQRVETAFSNVEKLRQSARNLTVAEVAALSERVRVEIILDKTMSRSRKRWYRAYSDYLDEMVDERMEKEGIKRDSFQNWIVQYLKGLLDDD